MAFSVVIKALSMLDRRGAFLRPSMGLGGDLLMAAAQAFFCPSEEALFKLARRPCFLVDLFWERYALLPSSGVVDVGASGEAAL